jgi:predicted alpha/beta hydrolase family esterase
VTTRVVFLQGGGAGAHDADALLADSLSRHLGEGFAVDFPRMPVEDDPDSERWGPAIGDAIARAATSPADRVVLVGHSVGGLLLLEHLARSPVAASVAGVCIIAAPFPGGEPDWTFEGFAVPPGVAEAIPDGAAAFLYASDDDAIVPFAHRDLWAAALPGSVTRTTSGGHQLGDDLRVVADDIRATTLGASQ